MTDDQLEAALRDLGTSIDVPATPDVTASVRTRLSTKPRLKLRPVLTTVLAILLAFAVALAVSPEVRAGVAQFLRFAGIEFTSEPPPPLPTTPITTQLPPGERVVTLEEARKLARFPVTVPKALGEPKEVHVSERVVSLVYDNARVDECDGTISPIMRKFTFADLEEVQVNGTVGYWVGAPHEVIYVDSNGTDRTETARMSAKTLVWEVGKVTYRLEGDFTKEQAISIASAG
jgi:hypothetical protein